MKFLIYGSKGWIGGHACTLLISQGETVIHAKSRADDKNEVEKELLEVNPDRVMSFIGRTSGLNYNTIDYLEQKGKLIENVQDNLYGPLVLAFLCTKYGFHYTYLGTGCIFDDYTGDTGTGYSEEAEPNFFGSEYSTIKGKTDQLLHFFDDTVLNARIRMPIIGGDHPRNFITKIMTYKKVCSIPNSMTVLPDMLPILIDMSKNKVTGTINLTNPGLITHNEILDMVKELIDPSFTYENFTLEEQSKVLLGGRSNNQLNTDKLQKMYPDILPIKEAVRRILTK